MKKLYRRFSAAALSGALLLSGLTASTVSAQEATDDFASQMEQMFAEPDMEYKPYARMWLAEGTHTDETLIESIQELYDAGYGGIEFVALDESDVGVDNDVWGWGSEAWIHDSQLIIEECQKLGMSVSMTSGAHWATANVTTITPDEESASQELGYTVLSLEGSEEGGNTSYQGELATCILPGASTEQTLVGVVAARVTSREDSTVKLEMSSMKDVTECVTETDGTYTIDFTAEDSGDYDLFAFYQYGTSESYEPSVGDSYTINYLSADGAEALISYWDENVLTEDVQALIDQMEECDLYMDSLELNPQGENTTGNLWCSDMLEQFETRRGYDMSSLLPYLIVYAEDLGGWSGITYHNGTWGNDFAYTYEPSSEEDQEFADNLRSDYYQTLTELYTENCLEVLADWLHEKNMYLRAEPSYGRNFEISEAVEALDYVETESFEFGAELDSYRGLSGAAHLYNIRYSSETGAAMFLNYKSDNNYYRQIFYTQYAAGIQKVIVHGYSSAYGPEEGVEWPGYEGMDDMFSDRFSKRQPASVDYSELNLHLSRIQEALEQGVAQMDIAILRTDYGFNNGNADLASDIYNNALHTNTAYYWQDMELQNNGCTYDYFSPYLLEDENITAENGLLNADGVAYKALIVMEEELPYDAAVRMLEWAQDGMPILFVNNTTETINNSGTEKVNAAAGSTTGSNDGLDEELAAVVAEMKELENVQTVDSEADAMEALQEMGVYPRAQYVEENTNLLSAMRKSDDVTYLYLYNYMYEDEENYSGQISLEGEYEPYVLDTWSGEVTKSAAYSVEDGRTVLNVDLAPGETMILILRQSDSEEISVTDAENTIKTYSENGSIYAAVENGAAAAITLSDGTEISVTGTVPGEISLGQWDLVVDSYEPGETDIRSETAVNGEEIEEATVLTEHVELSAGTLDELIPWKDIESIGSEVSGVGTYTTTFTLPEDWDDHYGLLFNAESIYGGTVAVFVNDVQVPVNMDRIEADLSDYVQPGENTICVRVTSTLLNRILITGYSDLEMVQSVYANYEAADYGMVGDAWLTAYENIVLS